MTSGPNKQQRLLDLVAYLVARRFPVPRAQIWDEVEGYAQKMRAGADDASVRRTFERDKADLLELGFPLETVANPSGDAGEQQLYRLRHKDFYLPYLRLLEEDTGSGLHPKQSDIPAASIPPEDAWFVASALQLLRSNPELPYADAADSAFRKVTFDLIAEPAYRLNAPMILSSDDSAALEYVSQLEGAVRRRRVANFRYHSIGRDDTSERSVEPWAMLFKYGRWYLVAHDLDRDARRVFRVGRMTELRVQPEEGAFNPPKSDAQDLRDASAWDLPGDDSEATDVDVRFVFPRSLWASRNELGVQVEGLEGGDAIRRFSVRSADPFLRWLLSLQDEVSVVAPEPMRLALDEMRASVAALYSEMPARGTS